MDQLAPHIEYLLQRHDCVILAGMGAFIAVTNPARIDRESHRILPPFRSVCFNTSIKNDDGVMANSFRRRMRVSFDEGRRMLNVQIENLKRAIIEDGEVALGRIGTLRLTQDHTISFQPRLSDLRLMEEMGMPAVVLGAKKQTEAESVAMRPELSAKPESRNMTHDGVRHAESSPRHSEKKNRYHISVNKHVAHAVACLMLVAMAALSFHIPVPRNGKLPQAASVLPLLSHGIPGETVDEENVPTEIQVNAVVDSAASEPSHYLIVGTFRTADEAERFINLHSHEGHVLQLLEGKNVCRVSAASSDSSSALMALMQDEDFKSTHPQAWIWTRK